MKILITGGSGFLGKHIIEHYSRNHNVRAPTSLEVDFSCSQQVDSFFLSNKFDIVLHAAIKGGKRTDIENFENFITNLKMYENLKNNSMHFKKIVNFCSGAAFDREAEIFVRKEESIFNSLPKDFYGLAKNLIARDINLCENNFINLRLFGCFGLYENNNRFIKHSLLKCIADEPVEVHQDRYMDFFWVEDLLKVTDRLLQDENPITIDYNLCYEEKYLLTDIANIIKYLTGSPHDVILHQEILNKSYSGSGEKLLDLGVKLKGLETGIESIYRNLLRKK
jgi:GDP-L-fucose synthase